ncbi:hypothetical protein B0A48_13911 [Cryoendolithus antarcticus]|uniref:Kinesin motor domain-containing protein n=1 Tax=Cryoendolithus antarcticus TaxID=1507870 RepID=A0A1V8SM12_9PEZI|nr:hypothetical protein B0A48_13911 [Cryoendolithus antarcticus]
MENVAPAPPPATNGWTSPPTSPLPRAQQQRLSVASPETMRAKRGSRYEGMNGTANANGSRSSDEEGSKTAVKVAVRVRPPLRSSDPGFDLIPQRFRESTCEVPAPNKLTVRSAQGNRNFIFDRVFDEDASQQDIWGYVSDSVNSFVQGYNVSILAYGQSGAGKSYTMGTSGPEEQSDSEIMGIVPRAAQALFDRLGQLAGRPVSHIKTPKRYSTQALPTLSSFTQQAREQKDWSLKASYVEIYQDQLRDLLVPDALPMNDRASVAIREDKGKILLTGMTQVDITSVDDLLNALNAGSATRQTDATAINARSSRSHAVFSLNLVQRRTEQTSTQNKRMSMPVESMHTSESVITIDSKLHFVDLAGSERLKNTHATGERAQEGMSINQGLASLGKVISQLSTKHANSHISYRDSKLTRLLQDSLGGNAITFMVACITPAAFHQSESINTLTYAQRARAIQVRPEVQQSSEDSDKQATIDRLRAEVSFLRGQVAHSEDGARLRPMSTMARNDRSGRREAELQTQLMDEQEKYGALSQRHARLIAEIGNAKDEDAETPVLHEAIGEHATERLKRSNSFAEAVEQVVLEYEKTIQSLETSLSKTRSSLSDRESTLQDKETRITYMETIQQQLQARVAKASNRESNNDSYIRDLESRMEGSTTGEEKMTGVISELRKELARARDNGNNAEEYIAELEDRLTEAEQDQDIMQREIDRLEHVVERQRSIGRLDDLLTDLDGAKVNGDGPEHTREQEETPQIARKRPELNGRRRRSYDPFRPETPSEASAADDDQFEDSHQSPPQPQTQTRVEDDEITALPSAASFPARSSSRAANHAPTHLRSPTQDDFMADKLENLTQELFDLRSEQESTLTDYHNLHEKYQTALETLAKLEYDKVTPQASHPESEAFLASAGMGGNGGKLPSSSQSLSRELPSLGHQNATTPDAARGEKTVDRSASEGSSMMGVQDEIAVQDDAATVPLPEDASDLEGSEIAMLRQLHGEKQSALSTLQQRHRELEDEHRATLEHMEDLRTEVQRSHAYNRPLSPSLGRPISPALSSPGFTKPVLRRKSEDLMGNDRASRGFASLKNIALDHFDKSPDTLQSFELNLNAVMTELHGRSERVHALESELVAVKREMEGKQTLIAGLTRERTSLKASTGGMDFSVVGQMREQLLESERQIRGLHEQHAGRERELLGQVEELKGSLNGHQRSIQDNSGMPGYFPETPALERSVGGNAGNGADVARLQSELAAWETKHQSAMASMQASEAKLLNTITDMQRSIPSSGAHATAPRGLGISEDTAAPVSDEEREQHKTVVSTLQREVEDYKTTANNHVTKLQQLEQAYAKILAQVEEDGQSRELTQKELKTHKDLVSNLENQLQVHKSAITIHQESLESLQSSHSKELDQLKGGMDTSEKISRERFEVLEREHEGARTKLQGELVALQGEHAALLAAAAAALGTQTNATKLRSQIEGLVEEGKELHSRHTKTTNDLKLVQEELQSSLAKSTAFETQVGELKMGLEEAKINLGKMTEKERKSSRLVDELEEQLNSNFDSHRATNHRLSRMEGAAVQVRQEMEREVEELRLRNAMLEQQLTSIHRQSTNSDRGSINFNRESLSPEAAAIALARSPSQQSAVRKSTPTALPTPPPSIPLPPLPGLTAMPSFERATSPVPTASPPGSRHASKDVAPALSQQLEEQDSRIRTIEKHLFAEKQLTATLEEALVDLETSANRTKADSEAWKRKCSALEDEMAGYRRRETSTRASLQAVEEEREMRVRAERARQALEQRMMELNEKRGKKKGGLNCF